MYNPEDWLGKERGPADGPVVVVDFGPLQVNVETTADVPPHDDVCYIWSKKTNKPKNR